MPWRTILYASLLYADLPTGVSAAELGRLLGRGGLTPWSLGHRVRMHMALSEPRTPLGGPDKKVYVDEAQLRIGPERRKVVLFAMTDGERCAIRIVPDRKASTLFPLIVEEVHPGSTIVSDSHQSYYNVPSLGFRHSKVFHTKSADFRWVNEHGDSTTYVEGIWANLKRHLKDKSANMVDENLWKFVAETTYRYRAARDPATAWWSLIGSIRSVTREDVERVRLAIDRRPVQA